MILDDLKRAYAIQHAGETTEVRIKQRSGHVMSGVFDDEYKMFEWIDAANEDPETEVMWWNTSPLNGASVHNNLQYRSAIKNSDISCRKRLLIDCDSIRETTPASDQELASAYTVFERVKFGLMAECRFDIELACMSGNGYQIFIRLDDWNNDPESEAVLRAFLEYFSRRFSTEAAKVDTCTYNAARVAKIPGSRSRKGTEANGRPYRDAELLYANLDAKPVTFEQMRQYLEQKGVCITQITDAEETVGSDRMHEDFDLERFCEHLEEVTGASVLTDEDRADGSTYYPLSLCPMADHRHRGTDKKSCLVMGDHGLGFHCFSDDCAGLGISDLLRKLRADGHPYTGKVWKEWNPEGVLMLDDFLRPNVKLSSDEDSSLMTDKDIRLTDVGNAIRLVRMFGNNILYCPARKCSWSVWDCTRWRSCFDVQMNGMAKLVVESMFLEAEKLGHEDAAKLIKFATSTEKKSGIEAMISLARNEVLVGPEEFDPDPYLFNVTNGTLNLMTGVLQPHNREDRITRLANVNYDPKANCPVWDRFLIEIMDGKQHMVEYLKRCVGYSLTGSIKEQKIFIPYGTGANGKTVFLEAIKSLLGEYAETAEANSFMMNKREIRNDLAKLHGARFVTASEPNDGKRLDEGIVKQMTGRDKISARFLNREFFDYTPQFKIWLSTNHKPKIVGTDNGIWRRIQLIPFTVRIPDEKDDKNLPDKIQKEMSGILNWALDGLRQWRTFGLQPPAEVAEATRQYRESQDVLGIFIQERCKVGKECRVGSSVLYIAYKEWTQMHGEFLMSMGNFKNAMEARGFKCPRRSTGIFWEGIALWCAEKQIEDDPDELNPKAGAAENECIQ